MMNPTCPICGGPMLIPDEHNRLVACKCMLPSFTTNGNTMAYDFNEQLKKVRNWHATFYGWLPGARPPVPQVYQDAFKDGELEL